MGVRRRSRGACRGRAGGRGACRGPRPATFRASTLSCRWSCGAIICGLPNGTRSSTGWRPWRLPVVNPVALLRWNSDKSYLAELGAKGVPTVATRLTEALTAQDLDDARAAFGVRHAGDQAAGLGRRRRHVQDWPGRRRSRRRAGKRDADPAVDGGDHRRGRIFADVLRRRLQPCDRQDGRRPATSASSRISAEPSCRASRRRAASAWPEPRSPPRPRSAAYARVDMIADADGQLRIMELELIEPSLWLEHAPDGGAVICRRDRLSRRSRDRTAIGGSPKSDWAGVGASSRATSIAATSAFNGWPLVCASSSNAAQKIGSRLIEVW